MPHRVAAALALAPAALTVGCASAPRASGASRCVTADAGGGEPYDATYVRGVATAPGAEADSTRALYGIARRLAPGEVRVVADPAACARAAAAYAVPGEAEAATRGVIVVRAGDVYVVTGRPARRVGEWEATLVLDRHFRVIRAVAG